MSKGGKLNSICNKYFKKKKFCYLKIVVTCPIIQRHWLHSVLFADETAADSVVWERQMCFMKTLYLLSIWNFRHLIHSSATDVFSTTLWASSFSLSFFFLPVCAASCLRGTEKKEFVSICHNNFGTTSCVLKSISLKPTHILDYVVCSCTILTYWMSFTSHFIS